MVRASGMNPKIGVRVPLRSRHFLSQKLWHFHKDIRSCVENECCCPRTVNMSNVDFTSKYTIIIIPPQWHDAGSSKLASCNTRTYLFYIVNIGTIGIMGADTWLVVSPRHQHPWYWLYWTGIIRTPRVNTWTPRILIIDLGNVSKLLTETMFTQIISKFGKSAV